MITYSETSFSDLPNLRGGLSDLRGGLAPAGPAQAPSWLRACIKYERITFSSLKDT